MDCPGKASQVLSEKSEGLVKEEVASAKALESGLVLEGPV